MSKLPKEKPDRYILLGRSHHIVIDDLREMVKGSTFLYQKEHALQNVLQGVFAEMAFVYHQYKCAHECLMVDGTPELEEYISKLNSVEYKNSKDFILELHSFDLSTYFKCFLVLSKSVLDKLVPLYSYRFFDNTKYFHNKGNSLISAIKRNKHIENKDNFLSLIGNAKNVWIDSLIDLRDEYSHSSNLHEYSNCWLSSEWLRENKLEGIQSFNKPSIEVSGKKKDAMAFLTETKSNMVSFIRDFLLLCDFSPDRRPKTYLNCECGFRFAKKTKSGKNKGQLQILVDELAIRRMDKQKDYGVIICPKCGEKTDTDLKFWETKGLRLHY